MGIKWGVLLFAYCATVLAAEEPTKGLDGEFVEQIVPRAVYPGKPVVVTLRFKNTGTKRWEGDAVVLYPESPLVKSIWVRERMPLVGRKSVPPGEVGSFTVQAPSPTKVGVYDFQWKLHDELRGPFGGNSPRIEIRVVQTDWLTKVYQDLIGRPANGADQIHFFGTLQKEPDLHKYIVHLLLHSERADKMVQEAYRKFMGRRATVTETKHWQKHLLSVGINGLRQKLAESDDCYQYFGGTNHRYVTQMYQSFSEPLPTSDELETIVQGMDAAGAREALAETLTASLDSRLATVTLWYRELFPQRRPAKTEIEEWAHQLDPKITPVAEEVLATFYEKYSQPEAVRAIASEKRSRYR